MSLKTNKTPPSSVAESIEQAEQLQAERNAKRIAQWEKEREDDKDASSRVIDTKIPDKTRKK